MNSFSVRHCPGQRDLTSLGLTSPEEGPGDLRQPVMSTGADVAQLVPGEPHAQRAPELHLEPVTGEDADEAGREDVTGARRVPDLVLGQGHLGEVIHHHLTVAGPEREDAVAPLDDDNGARTVETAQEVRGHGLVGVVRRGPAERPELGVVEQQEVG